MWALREVTWQTAKDYFLSVHRAALASLRKPISFTFFPPVHHGVCQEESLRCPCSWLPPGRHPYPPLLLWLTGVVSSRAVEVRWPGSCHRSLSTPDTLGLPVHIPAFVVFCLMASPSLLRLVLSPSTETFEKRFFSGLICLLIAVPLCPISAQVQMGLAEWHHAKNHRSVAGPFVLSQAMWIGSFSPPSPALFLLKCCLLMSRKT